MIPETDLNDNIDFDFEVVEEPSYTPRLNQDTYRISGFIDGLESVRQAVYLILYVERYEWLIYTWNYGIELDNLFGKELGFVIAELERVITEAILQDDRVEEVIDFEFTNDRNKLLMVFTVVSVFGEFSSEFEFEGVA